METKEIIFTKEHLAETDSTNTYLQQLDADRHLPEGYIAYTDTQRAGRGQRGNSWESQPGKNLTFSLLLRPEHIPANQQFLLSQAVSLAATDVLNRYASGFSIKWPNDIYWEDKKIAGILIENVLSGSTFARSIVGIGLNINQERFISDAPNPVSLFQITGHFSTSSPRPSAAATRKPLPIRPRHCAKSTSRPSTATTGCIPIAARAKRFTHRLREWSPTVI